MPDTRTYVILCGMLAGMILLAGCSEMPESERPSSGDKRCVTSDNARCVSSSVCGNELPGYTCRGSSDVCCAESSISSGGGGTGHVR